MGLNGGSRVHPPAAWSALLLVVVAGGVSRGAEAPSATALLAAIRDRQPGLQDAEEVQAGARAALVLRGAESGATYVFGPVPVPPGTAFELRVSLAVLEPAERAQLQLLVRELAGGRALQPYHKNSVRVRGLPAVVGPCTKNLSFTTGPETDGVSGVLSFTGGPARLALLAVDLVDVGREQAVEREREQVRFRQQLERLRQDGAGREALLPRTLVYSRSQVKYGLDRDYTRGWIDRPLFTDRATREPTVHVTPLASFRRVVAIGQRYGIDGFAFFPETKGRLGVFEMIAAIAPASFGVLGEFVGSHDIEAKSAALAAALRCPQAARVDGKLLITSYGAESLSPEEWQTLLTALRARHGDGFLFLPSITAPVALRPHYAAGRPFDEAEMARIKARLRAYLDVGDGLYFNYPAAFKNYEDRRTFDDGFYRDVFIPVFRSVLAEPAYRRKYFGLSAYHSHYNADISLGLQEDNTKTLRRSMETALAAQPDVLILPEWDEQNENTSFRPTVCNSLSTLRIVRFYMARLKGEPLSPLSGDDSAVPNLVVSFRKILVLGEELRIELLNLPDGTGTGPYRVRVSLLDETGTAVHTFPAAELDGRRLHDVTLTLPTEALARQRAVQPEIRVEGWNGRDAVYRDGLHHVCLRASQNWDAKYVKLPLRDVLRPHRAEFRLMATAAGVRVRGELDGEAPIAYAEVLEDDDVVYAVDPTNEFLQGTPGVRRFCVEYRSIRSVSGILTLEVNRPIRQWFASGAPLHQPSEHVTAGDRRREIAVAFSPHVRWSVFAISEAESAEASLRLDAGVGEASCRLSDVAAHGPWVRTFANGLSVTVSERFRPLDLPRHLDQPAVRLDAALRPQSPGSVFHVRVIAKDGRIWRSPPMPLPLAETERRETPLRVYSASQRKALDVPVARGRIPSFTYEFSPRHGDVLWATAWPLFSGIGGGSPDSLTLQGGNGGPSATAFGGSFAETTYPVGPVSFTPRWAVLDGRACLEFDGPGAFVALPRETVPRHGAFTLEFDLRPAAHPAGPVRQYVFAHRLQRPASLSLFLVDGKLYAEYAMEGHLTVLTDKGLDVPPGQWSHVCIRRDFEHLTLEVNGQHAAVACDRPGFDIGPMAFGGFGSNPEGWFKGGLAGLRITHNGLK